MCFRNSRTRNEFKTKYAVDDEVREANCEGGEIAGGDKESGPGKVLARDMAWLRLLNKNSLLKGSGGTGGQWIDRALIQVNSDGGEA